MQGNPAPLLLAINQITTLEELSLCLGERQPVHEEGRPAMQLRLPKLCHLALGTRNVVRRMDVSSCPLLSACICNRTPLRAVRAVFPKGVPPGPGVLEALRTAWQKRPGPYPSCPHDSITFATEGVWFYDLERFK